MDIIRLALHIQQQNIYSWNYDVPVSSQDFVLYLPDMFDVTPTYWAIHIQSLQYYTHTPFNGQVHGLHIPIESFWSWMCMKQHDLMSTV